MKEVLARDERNSITDKSGYKYIDDKNLKYLILQMLMSLFSQLFSIPIQMLAYYTAVLIGTDVGLEICKIRNRQ